jgi:hypothetical protein
MARRSRLALIAWSLSLLMVTIWTSRPTPLPGVSEVEYAVQVHNPTLTILHIRDYHVVPHDIFAMDVRYAADHFLGDVQVDRLYAEHLQLVKVVQDEQMRTIRRLGIRRVFIEGLTQKDLPAFKEIVRVVGDIDQHEVPRLRSLLADYREMGENTEEIEGLLNQHRVRLLEFGAAARLLMSGELAEVLPLDDADLLDQANPVTPDGQVKHDRDRVRAREDAMVRAVLERKGIVVIILGGNHDLSGSVRRLGQGRVDYVRVTTQAYPP